MINKYITGYCPEHDCQLTIRVGYSYIPICGADHDCYKKMDYFCEYGNDCKSQDEYGRCKLFMSAPSDPYQ